MTVRGPWQTPPLQQIQLRASGLANADFGATQYAVASVPDYLNDAFDIDWDYSEGVVQLGAETVVGDAGNLGYMWDSTIGYPAVGGVFYLRHIEEGWVTWVAVNVDRFDQALSDQGPVIPDDVATLLSEHPAWTIEFELAPGSGTAASPSYLATGHVPVDGDNRPASNLALDVAFVRTPDFDDTSAVDPPNSDTLGYTVSGPISPADYDLSFDSTLNMWTATAGWPGSGVFAAPTVGAVPFFPGGGQVVIPIDSSFFIDSTEPGVCVVGLSTDYLQTGATTPKPGTGWTPTFGLPFNISSEPVVHVLADWQPPRYRIVKPVDAPLRQFPRDDGLVGTSIARQASTATSRQASIRQSGYL